MKKILATFLALVLILLSITVGAISAAAARPPSGSEFIPGSGVRYYRRTIQHGGTQNINAVVFTPSENVRILYDRTDVRAQLSTTLADANDLQAHLNATSPGAQVLAGINGDFFSSGAGDNIFVHFGMKIESGGRIIKTAGHHWGGDPLQGGNAIGFRIDDSGQRIPVIGIAPSLAMNAGTSNPNVNNFTITNINTPRSQSGFQNIVDNQIILYNYRWGPRTNTAAVNSHEVRLELIDGDFTVGGTLTGRVVSSAAGGNSTIGNNHFVISANGTRRSEISGLRAGDVVTMDIALTPNVGTQPSNHDNDWDGLDFAIGGDSIIVIDGVPRTPVNWAGNPITGAEHTGNHPRTAVGITANNEMVFMTVDGRGAGGSVGRGIMQVAQIMIDEFNVIHAMTLDGGGATTFVGRETTGNLALWNTPIVPAPGFTLPSSLFVVYEPTPPPTEFDILPIAYQALRNDPRYNAQMTANGLLISSVPGQVGGSVNINFQDLELLVNENARFELEAETDFLLGWNLRVGQNVAPIMPNRVPWAGNFHMPVAPRPSPYQALRATPGLDATFTGPWGPTGLADARSTNPNHSGGRATFGLNANLRQFINAVRTADLQDTFHRNYTIDWNEPVQFGYSGPILGGAPQASLTLIVNTIPQGETTLIRTLRFTESAETIVDLNISTPSGVRQVRMDKQMAWHFVVRANAEAGFIANGTTNTYNPAQSTTVNLNGQTAGSGTITSMHLATRSGAQVTAPLTLANYRDWSRLVIPSSLNLLENPTGALIAPGHSVAGQAGRNTRIPGPGIVTTLRGVDEILTVAGSPVAGIVSGNVGLANSAMLTDLRALENITIRGDIFAAFNGGVGNASNQPILMPRLSRLNITGSFNLNATPGIGRITDTSWLDAAYRGNTLLIAGHAMNFFNPANVNGLNLARGVTNPNANEFNHVTGVGAMLGVSGAGSQFIHRADVNNDPLFNAIAARVGTPTANALSVNEGNNRLVDISGAVVFNSPAITSMNGVSMLAASGNINGTTPITSISFVGSGITEISDIAAFGTLRISWVSQPTFTFIFPSRLNNAANAGAVATLRANGNTVLWN